MRHELHLFRKGFYALIAIAVVAAVAGLIVDGTAAATSAAIGVGLVALNQAIAVASTAWSRTLDAKVFAVGFGVFVFRMAIMLGAFGSLSTVGWIHETMLAVSFCSALVASLAAECIAYVRGSYVPAWRTR
jgi:hypothetical protein